MIRKTETLPQLSGRPFLTDGGLETTLVFHERLDLPHFAAFVLLDSAAGRAVLRRYNERYAAIAARRGAGLILETPTWRASRDWGLLMGRDPAAIAAVNRDAVAFMAELREEYAGRVPEVVLSGCIGPRADGYVPEADTTADEAAAYHAEQIGVLADAGVDVVSAYTIPQASEAEGIARAAAAIGVPVVIGFTVETDGRLPSGESLPDAIVRIDAAAPPAYYMINCAHPSHFQDALQGGEWLGRIRAVRANASRKSHAELDASTALDAGDPAELAARYHELRRLLPNLNVVGGCCGTDHRHVEALSGCLAAEA